MRVLNLLLAGLFFALAVLGVFLPVLPTTPFLLLTSWCLVRAAPRLDRALRRSPLFGPLLEDWRRHRGLRPHVKVSALGALAIAVAASLWFGQLGWIWGSVLVVLAAIGAAVILRLKTVRDDAPPGEAQPGAGPPRA